MFSERRCQPASCGPPGRACQEPVNGTGREARIASGFSTKRPRSASAPHFFRTRSRAGAIRGGRCARVCASEAIACTSPSRKKSSHAFCAVLPEVPEKAPRRDLDECALPARAPPAVLAAARTPGDARRARRSRVPRGPSARGTRTRARAGRGRGRARSGGISRARGRSGGSWDPSGRARSPRPSSSTRILAGCAAFLPAAR